MRTKWHTRGIVQAGLPLIGMVNRELALDLDLFTGRDEILRAIERRDYDVLSARLPFRNSPRLSSVAAVCAKSVSGT